MKNGRSRVIHDSANASACGARSTTARSPSSGRGNLRTLAIGFKRSHSLKDPMLRGRAQLLQAALAPRFGVDAHHGLGPRKPVANPRTVTEDELQSVGPHDLTNLVAAEFFWILP